MKSVMISIQPKWCEKIINIIGQKDKKPIYEKSVEIRKTRPKIETPFKCYIYCTKGYVSPDTDAFQKGWRGYVIGEFICKEIVEHTPTEEYGMYYVDDDTLKMACLSADESWQYGKGRTLYAWHISDLVIYDEPKELSDFVTICPEWEKEYFDTKCLSCKYYFSNCADMRHECIVEGEISITRPPQSWCYVVRKEDEGK